MALASVGLVAVACGGDTPGDTPPTSDGGTVLADGAVIPGEPVVPFDGGGGGSGCGGRDADPAAAATLDGYIGKLQNAPKDAAFRGEVVDAILRSCAAFGPSKNSAFTREHCWALLAASISKESSYKPEVSVKDGYGTRAIGSQKANDPVVGLLQIRFSSTVHEMVAIGNRERLACVGCAIPDAIVAHASEGGSTPYWAVTGPSENMALMQNVACNVGMGSWFYFVHATGNGNAAKVTYPDAYCKGEGTAGNAITGLLSHLMGSEGGRGVVADQAALEALRGKNAGGYGYVTEIKTLFESMVGPPAAASPFFAALSPDTTMYCR